MNVTSELTFQRLLEVHRALDELFFEHQAALLGLDFNRAQRRLAEYRSELVEHMRYEEEVLLPVYERAGAISGGPIELFIGEHRRMMEFIDRFSAAAEKLEDAPDALRGVIALLDDEAVFKNLCQHHDQRERNILFPALDRVTGESERADLIARGLAANSLLLNNKAIPIAEQH